MQMDLILLHSLNSYVSIHLF